MRTVGGHEERTPQGSTALGSYFFRKIDAQKKRPGLWGFGWGVKRGGPRSKDAKKHTGGTAEKKEKGVKGGEMRSQKKKKNHNSKEKRKGKAGKKGSSQKQDRVEVKGGG